LKQEREYQDQCALFQWVAYNIKKYPELKLLHASANGGLRNKIVAAKLKRSGVRAGVPDVCLPIARMGYNALYIEMKVKPNKPTKMQLAWHDALMIENNKVVVCYGWEAAVAVIEGYIDIPSE